MATKRRATIEDLYNVPEHGKAEIVNGELVLMSPTGFLPARASANVYTSLRAYERETHGGFAIPDNTGFLVRLPNRDSFSPDAAFYTGLPTRHEVPRGRTGLRRRSSERKRLRPRRGAGDGGEA